MSERSNLFRKLAYAVGIAALLFPLSQLGAPLQVQPGADGEPTVVGGGGLARFRSESGLSQASLGEIDPASETLKLATLGLRGVAVNALWLNANDFKMKEDWGNLTATLEQLAKLQPNYITFWKYQAWNLTYNVSVEFDDYRDRYYYVRRGIEFLKKGEGYNRDNPQLLWELGWFIGQKIGIADEKVQYRRLFRTDEDFHPADRPQEQRDNWLVGKEWYRKAERAAEKPRDGSNEPRGIGRKSPVVFYSSAPKNQMNYSEAIEEEGRFDRGLPGWRLAGQEWQEFGNLPILHSTGTILNLNEEEYLKEQVENARRELAELAPQAHEALLEGVRAKLTEQQLQAYDTPEQERTEEQVELARQAEIALSPPDEVLVATATEWAEQHRDEELALEARRKGQEIAKIADRLRKTINYKSTANFDYWKLRCEFEQSPDTVNARKFCYQAKRAMIDDADPERSKQLYEQGLAKWRDVLDAYPTLRDVDGTTGDDIMVFIRDYANVLEKIDEVIPDDFPLWDVIESFDAERDLQEELADHRRRMSDQRGASAGAPSDTSEAGASE